VEVLQTSVDFEKIRNESEIPSWTSMTEIIDFIHTTMKPYEDTVEDIGRALEYAFDPSRGGFLMLMRSEDTLAGALLMLRTNMGGYIPENILLFVTVSPQMRGRGLGQQLISHSIEQSDGNVKLHVEYDNPAKRLYERMGFTTKYAEMRFEK